MNHFLFWYKLIPSLFVLIGLILVVIAVLVNRLIRNGILEKGHNSSVNMGIATLSFVFLWGFNFLNMEWIAIPQGIIILGSLCNGLAVWTNGGYMPVHQMGMNDLFLVLDEATEKIKKIKGIDENLVKESLSIRHNMEFSFRTPFHKVLTPKTRLKILCDWIPWRYGKASIGDLFITVGTGLIVVMLAAQLVRWLWS